MRKYFYENKKETIMDLDTFRGLTGNAIDKTIRKNANKRKALKNG